MTYDDILAARAAIADATLLTPMVHATRLSMRLGFDLYLKLENLQHTNAFKSRGALAKLLSLSDAERGPRRDRLFGGQSCAGRCLSRHAARDCVHYCDAAPHAVQQDPAYAGFWRAC